MNEYIGIDIGGTKISVIRGDAAGNILEKKKFATKTKDETDVYKRQLHNLDSAGNKQHSRLILNG